MTILEQQMIAGLPLCNCSEAAIHSYVQAVGHFAGLFGTVAQHSRLSPHQPVPSSREEQQELQMVSAAGIARRFPSLLGKVF